MKALKVCHRCGVSFSKKPGQGRQKYCSKACYHEAKRVGWGEGIRASVRIEGDCWIWTKSLNGLGYGRIGRTRNGKPTWRLAHRVSYEHFVGPIPKGMFVLHRCDTPPCVNPDHLFLGTHAENMHDMLTKGRREPPATANRRNALSADQVLQIRSVYPLVSTAELARRYGVHRRTIASVGRRETWKEI